MPRRRCIPHDLQCRRGSRNDFACVRDLAKIGIYGGVGSPGLLTGATRRSAARSRPGLLSAGSEVLSLVRNRERAAQLSNLRSATGRNSVTRSRAESSICRHRRLGVRPPGALGALARSTRCQRPAMPLGSAQLPWSGRCAASRLACAGRRGGASPTAPGCAAARCIRALPRAGAPGAPMLRHRRSPPAGRTAARRKQSWPDPLRRRQESPAKRHHATAPVQGSERWERNVLPGQGILGRLGIRLQQVMPAIPPCAGTRSQPADRHIVPLRCCILLLYKAREPWPQDFEFICLTWGGAKGIRTPDLLHAINRQHIHRSPPPQVTVPERTRRSAGIQAGCGTSVLYESPLLPAGLSEAT